MASATNTTDTETRVRTPPLGVILESPTPAFGVFGVGAEKVSSSPKTMPRMSLEDFFTDIPAGRAAGTYIE